MIYQKLPTYVANCLVVTGFDDIDSIRELNVSGSNNSITMIETFIDKRKDILTNCMGPNNHSSLPFEFPPGHKICLIKCIQEIQNKFGGPTNYLIKKGVKRACDIDNSTSIKSAKKYKASQP